MKRKDALRRVRFTFDVVGTTIKEINDRAKEEIKKLAGGGAEDLEGLRPFYVLEISEQQSVWSSESGRQDIVLWSAHVTGSFTNLEPLTYDLDELEEEENDGFVR